MGFNGNMTIRTKSVDDTPRVKEQEESAENLQPGLGAAIGNGLEIVDRRNIRFLQGELIRSVGYSLFEFSSV